MVLEKHSCWRQKDKFSFDELLLKGNDFFFGRYCCQINHKISIKSLSKSATTYDEEHKLLSVSKANEEIIR